VAGIEVEDWTDSLKHWSKVVAIDKNDLKGSGKKAIGRAEKKKSYISGDGNSGNQTDKIGRRVKRVARERRFSRQREKKGFIGRKGPKKRESSGGKKKGFCHALKHFSKRARSKKSQQGQVLGKVNKKEVRKWEPVQKRRHFLSDPERKKTTTSKNRGKTKPARLGDANPKTKMPAEGEEEKTGANSTRMSVGRVKPG